MLKPYILYTDGSRKEIEPKNKKDFSLEELSKIVNGYIEIIYLNNNQLMVLNEEGKLNNLPYNSEATKLASTELAPDDFIVGNVLVCNGKYIK